MLFTGYSSKGRYTIVEPINSRKRCYDVGLSNMLDRKGRKISSKFFFRREPAKRAHR